MKRAMFAALLFLGACGGAQEGVKGPRASVQLAPELAAAFREEATGDPAKAIDLYARVLDAAAQQPDDPSSLGVAMAALDALVHRSVAAFATVSATSALADRVPGGMATVDARLGKIAGHAEGPFVRPLVAYARLALAERRGDARAAGAFRAESGCVREALLVGPVSFAPVSGVREPGPFDREGAPIPGAIPGAGPFSGSLTPARVAAFGCNLPLFAQTSAPGVRDVAVDVDAPRGGWIGVGLRAPSAAVLRAGGKIAIERPHAAGAGAVARFARVLVTPGVVRVVVRFGLDQDFETVEIGAWDENGKPLRAHAPTAGQRATSIAKEVVPVTAPAPRTDDERLAVALGAIAADEGRGAEALLQPEIVRSDAPPELLLAYGRAVRTVRDLPFVKATERARAAYDRALEGWPASWEAVIEHAVLAGARRGPAEANLEALTDLDKTRGKSRAAEGLLDAFEAQTAGRENLVDRARGAYERAAKALAGTPLLRDVERAVLDRTGREAALFDCDPAAPSDKTSLACHHALHAAGDRAGAEKELERLRALAGTPQLYLSLSTRNAIEAGDLALAAKVDAQMNPGDRQLSTLYAVKGKAALPELLGRALVARDAPSALPGLLRAGGDDPLALYDGIAEKVTAGELGPAMANAATAVLAHDERYDVAPSGLVRFTMLDVRRVMGTTDVEANAQAAAPMLAGRDVVRVLRRRIFKKDGRIILPDRTPHAAQSHADLSMLEAGDAVEAIYEGFAVPGETGNIGVDTPDLLTERTAVRDARIEIRLPPSLRVSMWSHPLLGKADERLEAAKPGDRDARRVLVWHLENRPIRRLESGVPKMDRNACVSFSTTTWSDVARALREGVAALDAESPEVTAWAKESAKGAPPSRALVDSVVAASGQAVKEASGIVLADIDLGRIGGHTTTARTVLATHEGSRTWLLVRSLRELGVPTDVVVAENEPFSDSPSFPPHFGRFMHPLAVAHLPDPQNPQKPGATTDVWIDADVPGPPLPAGRISPELRGRMALYSDGRIAALPTFGNEGERDEIDERLVVDDQGNAKGSLTVLLRGRAAQDLAEALVRLVGQERQRALRGIALAWVPFATVEKVELSSSEGSWQVAIRAELTAPAYAQVEGTKPGARTWVLPGIDPIHYVFPRPYVSTLGSTYASHGARENALAINHATQYHVRRRVELPAKAQILRLPGPFDAKGPLIGAQRKISVAGATIEEDFTLDVTTGTIARDKYDDFVTQAHRADDAFRASTRVRPPAP